MQERTKGWATKPQFYLSNSHEIRQFLRHLTARLHPTGHLKRMGRHFHTQQIWLRVCSLKSLYKRKQQSASKTPWPHLGERQSQCTNHFVWANGWQKQLALSKRQAEKKRPGQSLKKAQIKGCWDALFTQPMWPLPYLIRRSKGTEWSSAFISPPQDTAAHLLTSLPCHFQGNVDMSLTHSLSGHDAMTPQTPPRPSGTQGPLPCSRTLWSKVVESPRGCWTKHKTPQGYPAQSCLFMRRVKSIQKEHMEVKFKSVPNDMN